MMFSAKVRLGLKSSRMSEALRPLFFGVPAASREDEKGFSFVVTPEIKACFAPSQDESFPDDPVPVKVIVIVVMI